MFMESQQALVVDSSCQQSEGKSKEGAERGGIVPAALDRIRKVVQNFVRKLPLCKNRKRLEDDLSESIM